MRNDQPNLIVQLTFDFSIKIISFVEELESVKKKVIPLQLLKSGTSIGANVREAQNAESKRDFIHKFKIAAKEADETMYWLEICEKSPSYPFHTELVSDLMSITKVISKIIGSSKKSPN
jgi:four helix bundle protein